MGCNCGGSRAKEAMTAAAQEADRQRSEIEQRAAAEMAKSASK